MPRTSRYVLVVDNISSDTRTRDVEYEFQIAGKIRDIIKDSKLRCALVEYEHAGDAKYAWRKLHGIKKDGRIWKVDYATPTDFKTFGWKWYEEMSPERRRSRSRSPSPKKSSKGRSPSRSPSRSRSRSASPKKAHKGHSRSSSPRAPTPQEGDNRRADVSPPGKDKEGRADYSDRD